MPESLEGAGLKEAPKDRGRRRNRAKPETAPRVDASGACRHHLKIQHFPRVHVVSVLVLFLLPLSSSLSFPPSPPTQETSLQHQFREALTAVFDYFPPSRTSLLFFFFILRYILSPF